jgi:hypothetical protein
LRLRVSRDARIVACRTDRPTEDGIVAEVRGHNQGLMSPGRISPEG